MRRALLSHLAVLFAATSADSWAQTTPSPTAAVQTVVTTGAKRAKVPFAAGERMEYDVKFGAIRVGNAHMEVVGLDNLRGRAAWHTAFWVQGGNFLYRVNDVYESWMDAETLSSLRFVQELEEGGKEVERRFEIYPERAAFVQTSKKPAKEEKSVSQPLDDGSFLYFIRTIPLEEAIEITEVRMMLEGLAASRAAERVTVEQAEELLAIGESMRESVARSELLRYSDLNARLHRRVREISGHRTTATIIERLGAQVVRHQFRLALQPGRPGVSLPQHERIIEAVVARNPEAAEAAMRAHLASVVKALRAAAEEQTSTT